MGHSTSKVKLLGGAVGAVLALGVGVAAGVVPQPLASDTGSKTAVQATAPVLETAAVAPPVVVEEVPEPTVAPTTAAPTTTTKARPAASKPAAAKAEPAAAAQADAPAAAQAPAAPAAPAVPTRLNPTSAQVIQALQVLQARMPLFALTEAQARQFGDQVCTAFDGGNTYAGVKAQVQAAIAQVPLLIVSSADIDYAIRTAVNLFCPIHTPKLP